MRLTSVYLERILTMWFYGARYIFCLSFFCFAIMEGDKVSALEHTVQINEERVEYLTEGVDYKFIAVTRARRIDVHLLIVDTQMATVEVTPLVAGGRLSGILESAGSFIDRENSLAGINVGGWGKSTHAMKVGDFPGQLVVDGKMFSTVHPLHLSFNGILALNEAREVFIEKPLHAKIDLTIKNSKTFNDVLVNQHEGYPEDAILIFTRAYGTRTPFISDAAKYVCFFKNANSLEINKSLRCEYILKNTDSRVETISNGLIVIPLGRYQNIFERLLKPNSEFQISINYPEALGDTRSVVGGPALITKGEEIFVKDTDMSWARRAFGALDAEGRLILGVTGECSWHEVGLIVRELQIKESIMLASGYSVNMNISGRTIFDGEDPSPAAIVIRESAQD